MNRKLVGRLTVLSGIIGFLSYFLVLGAVNFNFEFFSNPGSIFSTNNASSSLLKWSMITDILGYYLLLLPLLFFIYDWLKAQTECRNVFTFFGAAYIFAGALGAALLAASWPVLLDQFPNASPIQQEIIKSTFENYYLLVGGGIWNLFDALMFGLWFIAIGSFIKRTNSRWGWFTILVGMLSALSFLGNILSIKVLAEITLNLYLIAVPLWAVCFGLAIAQQKVLSTK